MADKELAALTASEITAGNPAAAKAIADEAFARGKAEGSTEGTVAGAKAERERCAAIFKLPEAQARMDMAQHLAFTTDMTPEASTAMLKQIVAGQPQQTGKPGLADRMDGQRQPELGPDGGAAQAGEDTPDSLARACLAAAGLLPKQ